MYCVFALQSLVTNYGGNPKIKVSYFYLEIQKNIYFL